MARRDTHALHFPSETPMEKELCRTAIINQFVKQTNFNRQEVDKMLQTFHRVGEFNHGKVNRAQFREFITNVFGVTNEFMLARIYEFFDDDNNGNVELQEWMTGLSMAFKGTLDERIDYCYTVYDFTGKGNLNKEELFLLLKDCVIKRPTDEEPEEGIKDLVEICLGLLDIDRDGRISKNDFKTAVHNQPLLLEVFGKCLPDMFEADAFLSTCSLPSEDLTEQLGMLGAQSLENMMFMDQEEHEEKIAIQQTFGALEHDPSLMVEIGIEVKPRTLMNMRPDLGRPSRIDPGTLMGMRDDED